MVGLESFVVMAMSIHRFSVHLKNFFLDSFF